MLSPLEARADVVGSLLRPPELLEARERFARNELSPTAFKRVEDRAVDESLRLQEESGLDVVTDGEMRRLSFQSQLIEAVEGFADWDLDAFLWRTWRSDELEDVTIERPPRTTPWSRSSATSRRSSVRRSPSSSDSGPPTSSSTRPTIRC